jgi:hypothetical protein
LRPRKPSRDRSRMPAGSTFYDRIVPLLLVALAVVMVVMILVALGVLLGFVPFQ